jgi:hypothetical protein
VGFLLVVGFVALSVCTMVPDRYVGLNNDSRVFPSPTTDDAMTHLLRTTRAHTRDVERSLRQADGRKTVRSPKK